jgi:hypothetical protein
MYVLVHTDLGKSERFLWRLEMGSCEQHYKGPNISQYDGTGSS